MENKLFVLPRLIGIIMITGSFSVNDLFVQMLLFFCGCLIYAMPEIVENGGFKNG